MTSCLGSGYVGVAARDVVVKMLERGWNVVDSSGRGLNVRTCGIKDRESTELINVKLLLLGLSVGKRR